MESDNMLQETPDLPLKKKALLEALRKSLGNISSACNYLDISRQTYYRWLDEDEAFREAVQNINEQNIDFVESKLLEKINGKSFEEKTIEYNGKGKVKSVRNVTKVIQPDTEAIKFYLKTKGKERGYVEKTELDLNGKIVVDFSEDGDKTPNKAAASDGLPT